MSEGSIQGILSCQHRELPSLPPSWHQDLPISKLSLQQESDFGQQGFICKYALNIQR